MRFPLPPPSLHPLSSFHFLPKIDHSFSQIISTMTSRRQSSSSSSSFAASPLPLNSPIFLLSGLSFLLNFFWTAQGLRQQSAAIRPHQNHHQQQQRMCFQCHMPLQCKSGFCFGDFCVKSLVADKYVSKGCENRSSIAGGGRRNSAASFSFHGSAHTRSALSPDGVADDQDGEMEGTDPGDGRHSRLKVPIPSLAGIAPGCIKMNVFGQPNVICYCNDVDYCNGARAQTGGSLFHFVPLMLICNSLAKWRWKKLAIFI